MFGKSEKTDIIKDEESGLGIMRIKDRLGEIQLQRALKCKKKKIHVLNHALIPQRSTDA